MNNSTAEAILKKYQGRMFEYYQSEAWQDGIGYPMKWDDEFLADLQALLLSKAEDLAEVNYGGGDVVKVKAVPVSEIKALCRNEKTPEGADSYSLTLNSIDYKATRQVLLDLLSQYQELDMPANPDLLKIHIDNATDRIEALCKRGDSDG